MANTPLHIPELGDKFKDYRNNIGSGAFNWAWERKTTDIIYLVIHHSASPHEDTPDKILAYHKARGWQSIGYHFFIDKLGVVWYVGDVSTARANVADMNEKVVGICVAGDFTKHLPSDEQIISANKLCQFFINQANWPNLKSWENVVGHKELSATACPGSSWKGATDSMYERIKNRIPYTPQVVQEEHYSVVYKSQTLAQYDKNPIDIIDSLTKQLETVKENMAQEIQNNATLQASLTMQEKDNAQLLADKRVAEKDRDIFLTDLKEATGLAHDLLNMGDLSAEKFRAVADTLRELTNKISVLEAERAKYKVVKKLGKYFIGKFV